MKQQLLLIFSLLMMSTFTLAQEKDSLSQEEKERREKNIQAGNPFKKYGYTPKIATLSDGKYLEFHDLDSVVIIGSVYYNRVTKKVIDFVERDMTNPDAQPLSDVRGRWLSPDPLSEEFDSWTPYNYAYNSPLRYGDPTGLAGEDFVKRPDGTIYWDNKANDQATTQAGDTYLGKELTFTFNSYIDAESWDGLGGDAATGDKLTSTVTLSASENDAGELTDVEATKSVQIGDTPLGDARAYYPGEGGSNNNFFLTKFTSEGKMTGFTLTFEQHASVSWQEEIGLNAFGYNIVDVSQKMNVGLTTSSGNLQVNSYTNIFPSATLNVNGNQIMKYKQPSFEKTHKVGFGNTSYYPSVFYKR